MLTYIAKLLFDSFDAMLATRNAIHLYFHEGLCCIHKFRAQKVQKERAATLCQCCCPLVVNSPNCDTSELTFAFGVLYARGPHQSELDSQTIIVILQGPRLHAVDSIPALC